MTDAFDLGEALGKYIVKPSEMSKPEFVLLYSRPGGGKTHLAASASELPDVRKILILDTEGSTAGTVADFDDDKVDIIPVSSIEQLDAILEKLFDPEIEHGWDAVVIDTLDVAQEWKIKQQQKIFGTSGDGVFAAWREVKEWTLWIGRGLKKMKPLGIAVFHDREEKDADGSIVTKLQLSGSAKDIFPGIPDVVVYLVRKILHNDETNQDEEHTIAYFASSDNKVTKNRFKFPPVMLDPSFPKMYELIAESRKAKENN